MIARPMIIGDLLRPYPAADGGCESATWRNIRWLHALIATAIRATGRDVALVSWGDALMPSEGVFFDTPYAYNLAGEHLSFRGWARLAAERIRAEEVKALLCQPFENALVVGSEMPDAMLAAFAERAIPFIDVPHAPDQCARKRSQGRLGLWVLCEPGLGRIRTADCELDETLTLREEGRRLGARSAGWSAASLCHDLIAGTGPFDKWTVLRVSPAQLSAFRCPAQAFYASAILAGLRRRRRNL